MDERSNSSGWATYLRVSDEDKQTPERSFAMQRQRIQEQLLVPSNIPFKREYCDILSGTTPNRADYQQMLSDAEAGLFSHLGLYRADRFGRNTIEGLQAATRLISIGIKIRMAHMPSLMPETPDGFFMFLLQMGLAQREVDVLKQRTTDGMEAKIRAGGWPHKAPPGYVNKERLVSSNKYERWVERDPDASQVLRLAWDLLLTGRYTLAQICEELSNQGSFRASGKPWAWDDPATGRRQYAENRLHTIFHNPFYSGWVVSEAYGIKMGEVKGNWEPIITQDEYDQGVEILRKHDEEKTRHRKHFYLLRKLLWLDADGKQFRMQVSTPTGKYQSYAYYMTWLKTEGRQVHILCNLIDAQIPAWLNSIMVNPDLIPAIQKTYRAQLKENTEKDRGKKIMDLKRLLSRFQEEETRLGRLLITDKISQEAYDQLRKEWKEKRHHLEITIKELEGDTSHHMDDLEVALALMTKIDILYQRLEENDRATLLQILARRIIVNREGEIINHELNSPFTYLRNIVDCIEPQVVELCCSDQIRCGALFR